METAQSESASGARTLGAFAIGLVLGGLAAGPPGVVVGGILGVIVGEAVQVLEKRKV